MLIRIGDTSGRDEQSLGQSWTLESGATSSEIEATMSNIGMNYSSIEERLAAVINTALFNRGFEAYDLPEKIGTTDFYWNTKIFQGDLSHGFSPKRVLRAVANDYNSGLLLTEFRIAHNQDEIQTMVNLFSLVRRAAENIRTEQGSSSGPKPVSVAAKRQLHLF